MTKHPLFIVLWLLAISFAAPSKGIDTSHYTIIKYDDLHRPIPYWDQKDESLQGLTPAELSKKEISAIYKLYKNCIEDYNAKLKRSEHRYFLIHIEKKYYLQFVAAKNNKGEKIVWVNCICSISDMAWREDIITVNDGGNCFFNFKINLTKNIFYDMSVNGDA